MRKRYRKQHRKMPETRRKTITLLLDTVVEDYDKEMEELINESN